MKKNKYDLEKQNEKNLKLMFLSALVLVALFIYTFIKGETTIRSGSYFFGIVFLFILMFIAFFLYKYKEKIRKKLPQTFASYLDDNKSEKNVIFEQNNKETNMIEPITSTITFNDIAGIKSVKEELEEIVDFLNNPYKYTKFKAKLPKGVLLVGPPGVGKTLIAKAVAGEAEVPFFYQSGASFVHIYVGMGAKRVKELFAQAKLNAPSIIFIDEIDAVGKKRGLGSNDEREATLNELLTQMDGFENNDGVIVIAATNKIETLDEALLRAGRFDRRVFLSLPTLLDREKIIDLYTNNKVFVFDKKKLAIQTSGFSSVALATILNEALLNMIKRNGSAVTDDDIEHAKQKVQYGKKEISILCDKQKEILALYQAAKAFITKKKVALFDEGFYEEDYLYPSYYELIKKIKSLLAGSVALEVIKEQKYALIESEIKQAKNIAKRMVKKYDMASSTKQILDTTRQELKKEIEENIETINMLKEKMLKDEIIVF